MEMLNCKRIVTIISMSLATLCASAQFYQAGDNPACVKWNHFKTTDFHLIYDRNQDSLAFRYASALEEWRIPVSRSIGVAPNGNYRSPMPVILHPVTSVANGSVTWAPRRMDLYTAPDACNPEPTPWISTLAVHESRHVAQLQFTRGRRFRWGSYAFGEMWGGALSALYGGPAFFEGDAVTAETALTRTGRGRKADFLEYPMVALDNGDWRDWYGWRYSSIKRYTPDHYKVGYMSVAGMRTVYDEPLFTEKFYERINGRRPGSLPLPLGVMRKTVREVSGKKPKESFREIEEAFLADWRKGFEERGPFMPMDTVTGAPRRFSEFTGLAMAGDRIFAIHKGLERAASIARIDAGGNVEDLRPFASATGAPQWSESLGRLFWSETIADKRWSMKSFSIIRYMDPEDKKIRNLTHGGRLFNPAPQPEGEKLAVTEYAPDSRSSLLVIDGRSGEELERYAAPDSLQIVEPVWTEGGIYVTAISDGGFGIYRAGAVFTEIISPLPVSIRQPRGSAGGHIMFVCDRSGVDEVYSLDTETGTVEQITCTRYGVADFAFSEGERELYYSALAPDARYVCRTAAADLPRHEVTFGDIHHYAIADELSAQEEMLSRRDTVSREEPWAAAEPRAWRKLPHMFHIHSWLVPLYVDYDAVKDLSFETVQSSAAIGATALFQNALGTSYGSVGYSLQKVGDSMRHAAHLKFNYRGLYPVIEAGLDFNDATAGQYQLYQIRQLDNSITYARGLNKTSVPSLSGDIRMYIPFSFSSGGWQRGFVPQIRYSASNSIFSTSVRKVITVYGTKKEGVTLFGGYEPGDNVLLHRMSASVRGFCMRPVAQAGVFPRLGIGAEAGVTARLGLTDLFSPSAFCSVYGYLPGIIPQHGLRLHMLAQRQLGEDIIFGENYTSITPRGLSEAGQLTSASYQRQAKMTAEYKMAVAPVDWTWAGSLAYIRNFEVTGFCDLAAYSGSRTPSLADRGTALSAGAEICAVLGNFLWIPYDTRIGVSISYNGGSLYDGLTAAGIKTGRTYIGTTFSIDL